MPAGPDRVPLRPHRRQVRRTPPLSAPEEAELAVRVAAGDAEARDLMVRANLGLVVRVAGDWAGRGLPLEDLISEGNLGLMRAVEGYDPAVGVRFSTYATHWIRQSIRAALYKGGQVVRLPAHIATLLGKWRRAETLLARRLGRMPADEEVERELRLSPQKAGLARAARRARATSISLDGTDRRNGDESAARDVVADCSSAPGARTEAEEIQSWLRGRLADLDASSVRILRLRYGLEDGREHTLKEVGREVGLSRERVGKIERRTLALLARAAPR